MLNADNRLEIRVVQLVMNYKLSIGEILGEEHRGVEVTRDYVGEISGAELRVNHFLLLFGPLCVASELQGDQDVLSYGSIKSYTSQGHLQSLELISCITVGELLALFETWGKVLQESRMDTKQNIPSRIANSSGLMHLGTALIIANTSRGLTASRRWRAVMAADDCLFIVESGGNEQDGDNDR